MGRFDPRYSKPQKRAIVNAIVVDGLTAPKACRVAAELGLPHPDLPDDQLPPFEFSVGYARHLAYDARRKLAGADFNARRKGTLEQRHDAMAEQLTGICETQVDRLTLKRKRPLKEADIRSAKALTDWLRSIRALTRGLPTVHGGTIAQRSRQAAAASANGDTATGELAALLSAHERTDDPRENPTPRDTNTTRKPDHTTTRLTSETQEDNENATDTTPALDSAAISRN